MTMIIIIIIIINYYYYLIIYFPKPQSIIKFIGEGVHVWDVEDKKYFDYLSAYSAVN